MLWVDENANSINLASTSIASVLITTLSGDFDICEHCFKSGRAFIVFPSEVEQISEQFDLEYKMRVALGVDKTGQADGSELTGSCREILNLPPETPSSP